MNWQQAYYLRVRKQRDIESAANAVAFHVDGGEFIGADWADYFPETRRAVHRHGAAVVSEVLARAAALAADLGFDLFARSRVNFLRMADAMRNTSRGEE